MAFFVLTLMSHLDGLEVACYFAWAYIDRGSALAQGHSPPLPSDVHSCDNSRVKLLQ